MNYGLIARADGLHLIRLPIDFDIQMMDDEEFNDLLTNPKNRVEGLDRKLAIDLVSEVGDYFVGKDYPKIHKLQPHEAEILLEKVIRK